MLQNVRGGYRAELAGALGQKGAEIAHAHAVNASRPGQRDLLGADVDACGVIAVREHQPDKFALPAPNVEDRPDGRRQKRRPDVTPVDEAGSRVTRATRVVRRVGRVQPVSA
jgi:hypothetical protein